MRRSEDPGRGEGAVNRGLRAGVNTAGVWWPATLWAPSNVPRVSSSYTLQSFYSPLQTKVTPNNDFKTLHSAAPGNCQSSWQIRGDPVWRLHAGLKIVFHASSLPLLLLLNPLPMNGTIMYAGNINRGLRLYTICQGNSSPCHLGGCQLCVADPRQWSLCICLMYIHIW